MKRIIYSIPLFVAIIGLSIIGSGFLMAPVFAETVVVKSGITATPGVTTTTKEETATAEKLVVSTAAAKEKAESIWPKVKAWGISIYEKVDAWRINQSGIWRDIKSEKELQITSLAQTTEDNRNERVENTLNGEQGTLFKGSSQDFKGTGNVFLLKLYVIALNIFLFIFTTPVIFYGIIFIALLSIISKVVERIRNPHGF